MEALPGRLVVDVHGVGYLVTVSMGTYDALNPVVGGEEDVVGLEIAVDDVPAVGGGKTVGDSQAPGDG